MYKRKYFLRFSVYTQISPRVIVCTLRIGLNIIVRRLDASRQKHFGVGGLMFLVSLYSQALAIRVYNWKLFLAEYSHWVSSASDRLMLRVCCCFFLIAFKWSLKVKMVCNSAGASEFPQKIETPCHEEPAGTLKSSLEELLKSMLRVWVTERQALTRLGVLNPSGICHFMLKNK